MRLLILLRVCKRTGFLLICLNLPNLLFSRPVAGESGTVAAGALFAVIPVAGHGVFYLPGQHAALHTAELAAQNALFVGFAVIGKLEELPQTVPHHNFGDQTVFAQIVVDRFAAVGLTGSAAPAPGADLFYAAIGQAGVEFLGALAQTMHVVGHFRNVHKSY